MREVPTTLFQYQQQSRLNPFGVDLGMQAVGDVIFTWDSWGQPDTEKQQK